MNNTNFKLKIGTLAIIAGLYSAGAAAEVATGVAQATVVEPLIIDTLVTMDFTSISGGTLGGTLVMDDAGVIGPTGDAIVIGGGNGTALGFSITGENLQTVIISVTNGVLSNGTPADDMALTMDAVAASPLSTTGAAQPVTVGGTLTVAGGQSGGSYTTTAGTPITITANYQ